MAICVIGFGTQAHAEPPLDMRGDITDTAGVLGDDTPRVQKALDNFTKETGFKLFVVYVESFDGLSGAQWADQTAAKSGIGTTDILLAVSTEDRRYGITVPREHPLDDQDFRDVETGDIRPALSEGDWAGAAIAAAQSYTRRSEESGLPWGPIVAGAVVLAVAGALVVHRVRRRYEDTHVVLDEHGNPV